jgi:hypothetical protein
VGGREFAAFKDDASMTRLSSGLPTGVDVATGVVTGSLTFRVLGSSTDLLGSYRVLGLSTFRVPCSSRVLGSSTFRMPCSSTGSLGSLGVLGSSTYRVLGETGFVTVFVGSFVIVGASNDAIEVVMGVLSRRRGPAETPRSTGGPSLGDSWWGIRVQCVLVCDT